MSDGYLADSGGFAYHRETNPLFQRFCLLAGGFAPPAATGAASVHCELGFRQGVGINAHAAAQAARFVGSDARSTRVAFAQSLAAVSGADVRLLDDSFAQLLERSDLPQFDSISVHAVWSGLSAAERGQLVRFIDRHLKPGGVLYLQYDTMPGLGPEIALRKIMSLFNQMGPGTEGGTAGRVRAALDFVKTIITIDPAYPSHAPLIAMRIDELEKTDPEAVAREYFNAHWRPSYFSDICRELSAARLDWACSALPSRTLAALQAPAAQQAILATTTHPLPRQQMLDYFTNAQDRADLFVRGARRLGSMEQRRALMDMRFVLLQPVHSVFAQLGLPIAAQTPSAKQAVFGRGLELGLSGNDAALADWLLYLGDEALAPKAPRGLLEAAPEQTWIDYMLLLMMLVGAGVAAPAQSEAEVAAAASRCAALNTHLLEAAVSSDAVAALVSPVLGGALAGIDRMQQLFLLARQRLGAQSTPEHWAAWLTVLMLEQGERMFDDSGAPLPDTEHALVLQSQAERFAQQRLPVLQALQIA